MRSIESDIKPELEFESSGSSEGQQVQITAHEPQDKTLRYQQPQAPDKRYTSK